MWSFVLGKMEKKVDPHTARSQETQPFIKSLCLEGMKVSESFKNKMRSLI